MGTRTKLRQDYKLYIELDGRRPKLRRHRHGAAQLAAGLALGGVVLCASAAIVADLRPGALLSGMFSSGSASRQETAVAQEIALVLPAAGGGASAAPQSAGAPQDSPARPGAPQGAAEPAAAAAPQAWQSVRVVAGDNMSLIFGRLGLSKTDLHEIMTLGETTADLKRIRPGQELRLRIEDGRLQELVHELDVMRTLNVQRVTAGFAAHIIEVEPDTRLSSATATIDSSLFIAGQKAGLSDNVIMQMIDVFGWDIDFALDVREGDRYSVLHEEIYKDGKKVRDGRILAAEFVNQGRRIRAVYYEDPEGNGGYYSEAGESMRKAFLRTPLNFTRISSRFNLARRHPVLNTIRAHRGVDYAAPHGTPVKATGTGKVLFVGNDGGYGKVIRVQHGGSYRTLYAHLSRFARGLKKGDSVRQGQTIGYVGQTGLATGPHLHYEFHVNGVHRNPLTIEFPTAEPIAPRFAADFHARAGGLLAQIDALDIGHDGAGRSVLAAADTDGLLPQRMTGLRRARSN